MAKKCNSWLTDTDHSIIDVHPITAMDVYVYTKKKHTSFIIYVWNVEV